MTKAIMSGVIVGCLLLTAPAAASHKWAKYHWARTATSEPVTLVYSEDRTAATSWSGATVRGAWNDASPFLSGSANRLVAITTGASGADVTVQADDFGATGWVGVAEIGIGFKNHIVAGQIKLNEHYAEQLDGNPAYEPDWRRSTYCMEAGHIFGLGHNNEGKRGGTPDDTCMNEDRWELSPNSHDTEQLTAVYNHGDGYRTFGTAAKDTPREWVRIHARRAP